MTPGLRFIDDFSVPGFKQKSPESPQRLPRPESLRDALSKVESVIRCSHPVGSNETEKTESLAGTLRGRGIEVTTHSQGVDMIGQGFIAECKLGAARDFDRLKGQIDRYYNGIRFYVVIFEDAKKPLLDDLRYYCRKYPSVHVIALGKEV